MINPAWPETWSELPAAVAMSPIPLTVNRSVAAPDLVLPLPSHTFAMLAD